MHARQKSAGFFRWLGIFLAILGALAIVIPAVAGNAVVIAIGCILIAAGTVPIVRGLTSNTWMIKSLGLTLGIITVAAGVAVVGHPLFGLAVLTAIVTIYLITEGIWKTIAALRFRPLAGWHWLFGSGIASLLFGSAIWLQWPTSELWAIGLVIGANLLLTGIALIALGAALAHLAKADITRKAIEAGS